MYNSQVNLYAYVYLNAGSTYYLSLSDANDVGDSGYDAWDVNESVLASCYFENPNGSGGCPTTESESFTITGGSTSTCPCGCGVPSLHCTPPVPEPSTILLFGSAHASAWLACCVANCTSKNFKERSFNPMKICPAFFFLLTILCLAVGPASAQSYFVNTGPINGNLNAFFIDGPGGPFGESISDGFVSNLTGSPGVANFGEWTLGGAPTVVNWSLGTTSFGSDLGSGGGAVTSTFLGTDGFGYGIYNDGWHAKHLRLRRVDRRPHLLFHPQWRQ